MLESPSMLAAGCTPGEPLQPLEEFYREHGLTLPPWQRVEGGDIPQPYRRLLVHEQDMTPTLESFHGRTIHIQVLERRRVADDYRRLVVLHLDGEGTAVEFGANRIRLDMFPEEARRLILEEREPLGHILRDFNITHTCRPSAYLKIASDARIDSALGLSGAHVLYGRHNRLFAPNGALISEVVEILWAAAEPSTPPRRS